MTKKDFFILIIKLFGLFSLVSILFSVLPKYIPYFFVEIDIISIIWIVAIIGFSIGLFLVLVFNSEKLVRLLKLEKGFDDDRIDLGNLNVSDVIKIGTFIIGGLLLIDNIPIFLYHAFFAFKSEIIGMRYMSQDKFNWVVSLMNLIIGYLLLTNYDYVARFFKSKKKKL
ncbi:MAG: hypothetical protein QM486_08265 [Flavobacteriaceae bacterium]